MKQYLCWQNNGSVLGVAITEKDARNVCTEIGDCYMPIMPNMPERDSIDTTELCIYNIGDNEFSTYKEAIKSGVEFYKLSSSTDKGPVADFLNSVNKLEEIAVPFTTLNGVWDFIQYLRTENQGYANIIDLVMYGVKNYPAETDDEVQYKVGFLKKVKNALVDLKEKLSKHGHIS